MTYLDWKHLITNYHYILEMHSCVILQTDIKILVEKILTLSRDEKKALIRKMLEPDIETVIDILFEGFQDHKVEFGKKPEELGRKVIEGLLEKVIYEMALDSLQWNKDESKQIFEADILERSRLIRGIEKYGFTNKSWIIEKDENMTGQGEIRKRLIKKIFEKTF